MVASIILQSNVFRIAGLKSFKQDIKGGSIVLVIFLNLTGTDHLHDHGKVLFLRWSLIVQVEHKGKKQHCCSLIPERILALRSLGSCVLEEVGHKTLNIIVIAQIHKGVVAVALGHVNEIHNADVIALLLQQVTSIT